MTLFQSFRPTLACLTICFCSLLLSACQGNFDQKLQHEAENYTNDHCPQRVDEGTLLQRVSYDPAKRVYTFHYQLSDTYAAALVTRESALREAIVAQLKDDVDYQKLKAEGITFAYEYRSESGNRLIYRTEVSASEYRQRQ